MSNPLEYLEEDEDPSDLFGSEPEAEPIAVKGYPDRAGPSTIRQPIPAGPQPIQSLSTGLIPRTRAQDRMKELRDRTRPELEDTDGRGIPSLKACCMTVIRQNRGRIWDVGDMEYGLIKPFLDELPIEQLVEIEENSPQIRKDTDWIWELYLLQDFPLFHEGCAERHGEERTSGWRRMYKKAKTEAMTRQASAAGRVAERYRQLEEEQAAKRIVFVDKVVPTRGKGGIRARTRPGQSSAGIIPKPAATAFGKARADIQRARVALTHASGKFTPPVPAKNRFREDTALFRGAIPALNSASMITRLPPPPSRVQTNQTIHKSTTILPATSKSQPNLISKSSPTTPIVPPHPQPVSSPYDPTPYNQARASLPPHLTGLSTPKTKEERFKLPIDHTRQQTIRKPSVQSFQPPKAKREVVDFFGVGPKGLMESLGRAEGAKRKRD